MTTAPYNAIELEDLLSELRLVRLSNIAMFRSLDDAAWELTGTANANDVTVRAIDDLPLCAVPEHEDRNSQ